MSAEDFDPSSDSTLVNGTRLFTHVLQKGFQLGSLVGVAFVAPSVAAVHKYKGGEMTSKQLVPKLVRAQATAALAGVALAGVMGAFKVSSYEDIKSALEDRAYRLHYNKSQSRVDKFAQAGMALCGTAAAIALGPTGAVVVSSASAGAAMGVLGHIATNKLSDEEPNKMIKEL